MNHPSTELKNQDRDSGVPLTLGDRNGSATFWRFVLRQMPITNMGRMMSYPFPMNLAW